MTDDSYREQFIPGFGPSPEPTPSDAEGDGAPEDDPANADVSTPDEGPLVVTEGRPIPESLDGKTVWVLDGHNIIYQVFHALPEMTGPAGQPVGAVYGFLRDLLGILNNQSPDYLFCAYDMPGGTFRNERYEQYKANRAEMPVDLRPQFRYTQRLLAALGIPALGREGFEADDVLATIAHQVTQRGGRCVLVTSDKDCRQLLSDTVSIFSLRKNAPFTADDLMEQWGVTPEQVVDFQALVGDSSDNVPGVPGIGPKTATELIAKFGSLDAVLDSVDQISGKKRKENLTSFREQALMCRELVKLRDDAPVPIDWVGGRVGSFNVSAVHAILDEFGFRSIKNKVDDLAETLRQRTGEADAVGAAESDSAAGHAGEEEPPTAAPAEPWTPPAREKLQATYHLVDTPDALAAMIQRLAAAPAVSVDTETTSLRPREAKLVGLSFCCDDDRAYYVPVRGPLGAKVLDPATTLDALRPVLENPAIEKIGQNLKYDILVLRAAGMNVQGVAFDTMVADYLLEAGQRSHGLDELAIRYLGHETIKIGSLIGSGKKQLRMDEVPTEVVCDYAAEDALVPWLLRPILQPRLEAAGLTSLFADLEMPLVSVLADMEYVGVRFEPELLAKLSGEYGEKMAAIEQEIYEIAGRRFNIGSPKQLRVILFEELSLPVVRKTKTGPSTDASVLEELAPHHPLPAKIVEYRKWAKLKNTYVDALPELINPETGRVHASFNQVVTATGRLSSSDPNLQNIPIREESGRAIRAALVPDDSTGPHLLVAADYSQIELRMLAHFCEDEELCAAFARDEDIHANVAAKIFNVPLDEVTSEQRSRAKAVNFGVIYGQSAFGLARSLGIPQDEAASFIDNYFAQYPGIQKFLGRVLANCVRNGFVTTILGRRRTIEMSGSQRRGNIGHGQLSLAERTAINTVIQGSAADLIKVAMLGVARRLGEQKELGATMLMQIHDELVFEVPEGNADELVQLVVQEMQTAADLRVPLKVDVGRGKNWAQTK